MFSGFDSFNLTSVSWPKSSKTITQTAVLGMACCLQANGRAGVKPKLHYFHCSCLDALGTCEVVKCLPRDHDLDGAPLRHSHH